MKKRWANGFREEFHAKRMGHPVSGETRKKMSLRKKGKPRDMSIYTDDVRQKCRDAAHAAWQDEEGRRQRVEANYASHTTPEYRAAASERMKGKSPSEETRQKISQSLTGQPGRPCTETTKKAISDAAKQRWTIPEKRDANLRALYKAWARKPNKLEKGFQALLDELFPGEYVYVGNGGLLVGGKCPDFMNVNGQKKLIEVYGDFWHQGDNPQKRIDHFSKFGFKTLVLWESEINADLIAVANRLAAFHND